MALSHSRMPRVKAVLDAHDARMGVTGGPTAPRPQPGAVQTPASTAPDATLGAEAATKGGRVLSKANYAVLKDAHDMIQTAHGLDEPGHAKGMYKAAQGHVKTVLDAGDASSGMSVGGGDQSPRPLVKPDGDGDGDGDKAAALARRLTAALLKDGPAGCSGRQLNLLKGLLDEALEELRECRAREALAVSA